MPACLDCLLAFVHWSFPQLCAQGPAQPWRWTARGGASPCQPACPSVVPAPGHDPSNPATQGPCWRHRVWGLTVALMGTAGLCHQDARTRFREVGRPHTAPPQATAVKEHSVAAGSGLLTLRHLGPPRATSVKGHSRAAGSGPPSAGEARLVWRLRLEGEGRVGAGAVLTLTCVWHDCPARPSSHTGRAPLSSCPGSVYTPDKPPPREPRS